MCEVCVTSFICKDEGIHMNGCGIDALWWLSHAELARGLQRVPVNSCDILFKPYNNHIGICMQTYLYNFIDINTQTLVYRYVFHIQTTCYDEYTSINITLKD